MFCMNCENTEGFLRDTDNVLVCQRCFAEVIEYVIVDYYGADQCDPNKKYFEQKIIYADKPEWNLGRVQEVLYEDYKLIRREFNDLNIGSDEREYFIKFELVLCFLMRKHNIDCTLEDFEQLKNLCGFINKRKAKKLHIVAFCWQIFNRLGWDNFFYLSNKDTMDQVQKSINDFAESLQTVKEGLPKDELVLVLERALMPYFIEEEIPQDTCDPQVNTCTYELKKGNRKGQLCGKRCKSNYCSKHSKRIFKDEVEQSDETEV